MFNLIHLFIIENYVLFIHSFIFLEGEKLRLAVLNEKLDGKGAGYFDLYTS